MQHTVFKTLIGILLVSGTAAAQKQEIGLLLGAFQPQSRSLAGNTAGEASFSTGFTLYANYSRTLIGGDTASLSFEVPFLATPQHSITAPSAATKDLATLYITPGLRLKFFPGSRLAPYVAAGGGYGLYEHSTTLLSGAANPVPRHLSRGVFDFGGGLDYRLFPRISLRGEIRDFVTGNPSLNLPLRGSIQHTVLFAGGIALRF